MLSFSVMGSKLVFSFLFVDTILFQFEEADKLKKLFSKEGIQT